MYKKVLVLVLSLLIVANISVYAQLDRDIVIFYDNDVHCEMSGYAKLAALRDDAAISGVYTGVVSCGDFAQGGMIGSYSHGESIVDAMNAIEYDVVSIGNHEFDYGVEQLLYLSDKLNATTVCSNFIDLKTNKTVFDPYTIKEYGDTKVAYVGAITTGTITSSSPLFFMENGEYVYDFSKNSFYDTIQNSVDSARSEGADYVVMLGHIGDIESNSNITSINTIANTTGIDVFIDGHAHSVIPSQIVKNKVGEDVILTSSGTKFANVGKVVISPSRGISSELLATDSIEAESDSIKTLIEGLKVEDYYIGNSDTELSIVDDKGLRLVRRKETGIGNFIADAFRFVTDTDIAMINGGGIRTSLPKGKINFTNIYDVFPFENVPYCVKASGQKVLDLLEFSVSRYPREFGGFMSVSGLKFKIDPTIKSCVVCDGDGMFVKFDGERRVCDVEVLNRKNGKYEPIDLDKMYSVSTIDYTAREHGDGNTLFSDCEVISEGGMLDTGIISTYITDYCDGNIPKSYASTEGRITILGEGENNLPLRKIFENSGFTVDWTEASPNDVFVSYLENTFKFSDGSSYVTYEGADYDIIQPAYIDEMDITRISPLAFNTVIDLVLLSIK